MIISYFSGSNNIFGDCRDKHCRFSHIHLVCYNIHYQKNVLNIGCPKKSFKEFLERLKDILKTILLIEKYNSNMSNIALF